MYNSILLPVTSCCVFRCLEFRQVNATRTHIVRQGRPRNCTHYEWWMGSSGGGGWLIPRWRWRECDSSIGSGSIGRVVVIDTARHTYTHTHTYIHVQYTEALCSDSGIAHMHSIIYIHIRSYIHTYRYASIQDKGDICNFEVDAILCIHTNRHTYVYVTQRIYTGIATRYKNTQAGNAN